MGTYFDPKDIKTKEELVKLGLLTDLSIIQDDSIEFADCKPYVADVTVSSQIVWPEADGAEGDDFPVEEGGADAEHQGGDENITPETPTPNVEEPTDPTEDDGDDSNNITFTYDDVTYTFAGDPARSAKNVFKSLTTASAAMVVGENGKVNFDFTGKKAADINGMDFFNIDN